MRPWTIKGRLIRSLITFVALFWVSGVVIAGLIVRHEIEEVFDSALRETTAQVIPVALHERSRRTADRPGAGSEAKPPSSLRLSRGHMHFRLRDAAGDVIFASEGAPADVPPMPTRKGFYDHGGFRYYARPLEEDGLWIEVAQEAHERLEAATGIWLGLVSPLLALLPLAALVVWYTVRRAAEPISRLSGELEARGGHHLEPIDVSTVPLELAPMVEAVNTLMQRLGAALDTERAFAANAAHELRNPVASARAQIQLLAANLHGTPDSARAENIASQLGQLGRRVEKLLQLSRAEAGLGHARERTDLISIVSLIVDEYSRRQDVGRRLVFEPGNDQNAWVLMDPDALAIVVRNAVENAVHHGDEGAPIHVRITGSHCLRISNACTTVPADVLQDLTRRFRRAGNPQVAGTGLGLAIVDTLMRQAGGAVTLHSPAPGRGDGFEIALDFPPAA